MTDLGSAGSVSRRTLLAASGMLVSSAVLAAARPARAAGPALSGTQGRMVLRVGLFGAAVPAPLPDFGEPGPAAGRATADRRATVAARLPGQRLTLVAAAADSLIQQGLLDADDATLLHALGERAADAAGAAASGLVALAALAAATVTRAVQPTADDLAAVWLAAVAQLSASTKTEVHG
jgi:hypothetical protein